MRQREVHELTDGDLFTWYQSPGDLHQFTEQMDGDRPICKHIATRDGNGKWRFHEPREQPWNPYACVQLAAIDEHVTSDELREKAKLFRSKMVHDVLIALASAIDGDGEMLIIADNEQYRRENA